jgi:hypothetical protein
MELAQQEGGRHAIRSINEFVAISPPPSNKILGICHDAASGCSMSNDTNNKFGGWSSGRRCVFCPPFVVALFLVILQVITSTAN